jgi:hypothetical protein
MPLFLAEPREIASLKVLGLFVNGIIPLALD